MNHGYLIFLKRLIIENTKIEFCNSFECINATFNRKRGLSWISKLIHSAFKQMFDRE